MAVKQTLAPRTVKLCAFLGTAVWWIVSVRPAAEVTEHSLLETLSVASFFGPVLEEFNNLSHVNVKNV